MNRAARSRGVSLIEALVALAVMAFGLLGVVGMQATLRYNADISKQRSEAVRMAQEQVEALRSFGALSGTADLDYVDIADIATSNVTVPTGFGNTTFERTTNVTDPVAGAPDFKTLSVSVEWLDRRTESSGTKQQVRLTTAIAGVSPELSASLGLAGDRSAPQRPRGRHASIPVSATPISFDPSRSLFTPPGSSSRHWIFNNATGLIEKVCTTIPGDISYSSCTDQLGLLLSGYINFSLSGTTPDALNPSDAVPSGDTLEVVVSATTTPAPLTSPECYVDVSLIPANYFCLVPTKTASPNTWSGRANLKLVDTATGLVNRIPGTYKVCRYTPYDATTPHAPAGGNPAHPLDYINVATSLINQNFLVINAAGTSCPSDSTPPFAGNTYRHQPDT